MTLLKRIWSPELFQGMRKTKNYFEGWYYKIISADRSAVYAVIPGIALGRDGRDAHAFIQVINGLTGKAAYFRFPFKEFTYNKNKFDISIGGNTFSREHLTLDLANNDLSITGSLLFTEIVPFPKSFLNPGIMGPYSFVPFMECYHGIVNISHGIDGSLVIDGEKTEFSRGEGYLEKDYGKSFPDAWIWLQANHFDGNGTSFMFSIAKIPWLGKHFTGIISFLLHDGRLIRLASYNGANLKFGSLEGKKLKAIVSNKQYTLEFTAEASLGGFLKAPKNGMMNRMIEESITASVAVTLRNKDGEILYSGTSENGGMELSPDCEKLLREGRE